MRACPDCGGSGEVEDPAWGRTPASCYDWEQEPDPEDRWMLCLSCEGRGEVTELKYDLYEQGERYCDPDSVR